MKKRYWLLSLVIPVWAAFLMAVDIPAYAAADEDDDETIAVETSGKTESEALYEKYKKETDPSEKTRLYRKYLEAVSREKKGKQDAGEKNVSREKVEKRGQNETASDAEVQAAYDKYANEKDPEKKEKYYKEYLRLSVNSKKRDDSQANDGDKERAGRFDSRDDKNSSDSKKNKQADPAAEAKKRSDEAYEKYRTAGNEADKKRYYEQYQKNYREYLALKDKKKSGGEMVVSNAPFDVAGQPGARMTPVNPNHAPIQTRMVGNYMTETPTTPLPQVSGGGGGNAFKKIWRKIEQSTESLVGAQTCAALELLYGINKDAALNNRLNAVAQRIAAVSDRRDLKYNFKIINMKEVNAFAVPGGTIYVTRDMMDFLGSDSELAAVLGHEMGHQVGKHSIKAIERAMLVEYFIGKSKAGVVRNHAQALQIANAFMALKYSRDNEMESDRYAFKYSTLAGYNPMGAVTFFEKLKNKYEATKTPAILRLLQTHPSTHDRLIESQNMARSYLTSHPEWKGYGLATVK